MLEPNDKADAFSYLMNACRYSLLSFEKRKELVEKWLGELEAAIAEHDQAEDKANASN